MGNQKYYITSESVTEGHPDKVCDYISDSILDACLMQDKNSRVAVETFISNGKVVVAGQISSTAFFNVEELIRKKLKEVGYDDANTSMDYRTCSVDVNIIKQSSDIAIGVDTGGAGDQGIMFGYACDETPAYMPYGITLAHDLAQKLSEVRKNGEIPYLKSDGKVQVTIEYIENFPLRIDAILISTQHEENVDMHRLQKDILSKVIFDVVESDMIDLDTKIYINPTGRFVIGGAVADTGLTGRKIIVDTYGGYAHHGGGAFSGKDATKVDRSASYMLRHIAKSIVASGIARRCELQIAYGIGMKEPISIYANCFGTNRIPERTYYKIDKRKI
jgi:S-adenosylmethionine synthetase